VDEQGGNEPQEPKVEEEQAGGFTLKPDYQAQFSIVYSNFALVSHTADDLCIDFCLMAPPHNVNAETKTISAPVIARVIIPPGLAQGLIRALSIQLEKQTSERQAGQILIPANPTGQNSDA